MKKLLYSAILALICSSCATMNNESAGSLTGSVVGGLLGSQFGGGTGKVLAAAGGAVLGAYIGGNVGRSMDKMDQIQLQNALEKSPSGTRVVWQNPDSGNNYTVIPTKTYYTHSRQPCREYVTKAIISGKVEQIYGKACRQADGSWRAVN